MHIWGIFLSLAKKGQAERKRGKGEEGRGGKTPCSAFTVKTKKKNNNKGDEESKASKKGPKRRNLQTPEDGA